MTHKYILYFFFIHNIMMKTRSRTLRLKTYRKRVKNSRCRGLGRATCRRRPGCKRATGKKRTFCRKTKNHHA